MTLADLITYAAGGITLPMAVYLVLQVFKRSHPGLAAHVPLIVLVTALVLVATARWLPDVFLVLAGTIILAAVILFVHGGIKNTAGPKGGSPPN